MVKANAFTVSGACDATRGHINLSQTFLDEVSGVSEPMGERVSE